MHLLSLLTASLSLGFVSGNLVAKESNICPRSESAPNPIAAQYPTSITGTLNSTLAVIPIPYKLARSIIPARYDILKHAYLSLLPGFPKDKYPLIVRSAFDHEVGLYQYNFSLPDFQSIHIQYPFVDVLGDGYSSFVYNEYLLITGTNTVALAGAGADGTTAVAASFDPDLDTYEYVLRGGKPKHSGEIYLNAFTNLSSTKPMVKTIFKPLPDVAPWPLHFYINVTNQPITNAGIICDNQVNLFNTTLSIGKNAPVGIKGDVTIKAPYLPKDSTFRGVYGIKVDIAFVEYPEIPCGQLKGYSGTGSGDR